MATQYRNDFFTLNQWEYFEFLVKQDTEDKKQIEDLYRIIEDRVNTEDLYLKGIERTIIGLEQINLKGFSEFVRNLIAAQREKLSVGRSYLFLVKKETLETIRDLLKKQTSDVKAWALEQKKVEKEYRYSLEKLEKLKNTYVTQAKECDLTGLEVQTMNVNREVTSEKRIRSTQKHIEYIKQKVDNEESYQTKLIDHNGLLERFKVQLEGFNKNLLDFKSIAFQATKQALVRFLDMEKTQSLIYVNTVEPLYSKLEAIDTQQITSEIASTFSQAKPFPAKIAPIVYHSFFQQAWSELQTQSDLRQKDIITAFRSYHENIIKSEEAQPIGSFEYQDLEQDEKDNISLVSYVIDASWRGEEVQLSMLQKFQQLLRDKFIRNVFVAGLQQYRLTGKFSLSACGYKNMKTILYYFLDDCLNARDVINTTKLMILSLTFWKVMASEGKPDEKKYLQASIKWHPIWKDLDFWMAAIFMSIHEEVVNKRSYKLEEQESEKETRERQKAIVCGQLLSYVHNMASFGVEKGDIKRIIKLYCQYYSLEDLNVREIMTTCEEILAKRENMEEASMKKDNKALKKTGLDSIRDFFIKKNSTEISYDVNISKNAEETALEAVTDKKASDILKTEVTNPSELSTLGSAEDT